MTQHLFQGVFLPGHTGLICNGNRCLPVTETYIYIYIPTVGDANNDATEGFYYMHHPTDRMANTMAFVTPIVEHWLEREVLYNNALNTFYLRIYGVGHMV